MSEDNSSTNVGSYHLSTISANMQAEIKRLDAQVDLFWESEKKLILQHGLKDGMDCLDCGCGPARMIELMRNELPNLRCTGLEMDPVLVEVATAKLQERGHHDCNIVQGVAEASNLPDESFDFITMRLVLEHVPDPVFALQSLRRLLRPGGRIFVVSNDFEYHTRTWPPVAELEDLYAAYCDSRREGGGDPCIGRRTPQLLKAAGFSNVSLDIEVSHSSILGDTPFLKAEGVGIPAQLVSSGHLEESTFRSMIKSWKNMLGNPDHSIQRQLFVATGTNDTSGNEQVAEKEQAESTPENINTSQEDGFVAPSSDLEKLIANHWRTAMGIDQVSVRGNFFDLGGDSLMLEEIHVDLCTQLGREVEITALFQFPTIETLAEYLSQAPDNSQANGNTEEEGPRSKPSTEIDEVQQQAQRRRDAMNRRRGR